MSPVERIKKMIQSRNGTIKESFNKIKINIDYLSADHSMKCLAITSSAPNEGKTFLAANIANAVAASGKKTLLIDADMRKSTLHKVFHKQNAWGLSEVLTGACTMAEVTNETGIDNLQIVTAGRTPPNPVALIDSTRMQVLINEMKEVYDYIVIDTPPVLAVPDAVALSKFVDGIILVARFGETKSYDLTRAHEALKMAHAPLVGCIMNGVTRESRYYQDGYGYDYGYYKDYTQD